MRQEWCFEENMMNEEFLFQKAIKKLENTKSPNPITPELVCGAVRKRRKDIHKGDCGRLLIVGGSTGLTGAACLSAMAALRCGCGLVTVACPDELSIVFEIKLTSVILLNVN